MDDAGLVRRARSGDREAWAEIYDRYADRLYDHCCSILRDRHEAEDALHDAFLTAARKIDQLRDPDRLRPWLYSICRTSALARTRKRTRIVPTADVAEVAPMAADLTASEEGVEHDQAALAQMVQDAAGGLEPRDLAVIDLHFRKGLVGKDLGEALGVSAHHAAVLLNRARDLVDRSLGALLVGRTGRGDCTELDRILQRWDGTLSPLVRKRVARHIDGCDVCGERRRKLVSPTALLGAAPALAAPLGLRQRILDDLARGTGPSQGGGSKGAPRRRVLAVAAVAAGVLLLALVAAVLDAAERDRSHLAVRSTTGDVATGFTTTEPTAGSTHDSVEGPTSSSQPLVVVPGDPGMTPESSTPVPGTATTSPGVGTTSRTDPASSTTSSTTTTTAPDLPPVVSGVTIDRTRIVFTGSACRSAAVSAHVTDEGAVTATLVWTKAVGGTTRTTMTLSGGVHQGRIGPVATPGEGPIVWHVEATDTAGHATRTADRTLAVGPTC